MLLRKVEGIQGVRGSAPGDTQLSLGTPPPPRCPGSPIWTIERKTQGVAVAEWSAHFLGKVLLAESEQCSQGIFFSYIPMQNNQWFSMERKNTRVPKWVCGLCCFSRYLENVTRAPSPPSPFHSSTALLLQFSHRLFCVVVVCLVLATIYGRLLNGVGGRFPIWEGRGVVPGSTGVLRVARPWVRCRAPPEGI